MRLVAYVRVSTDRQADEGLGLEVQQHAVKQWASLNGHEIPVHLYGCRGLRHQGGGRSSGTHRGIDSHRETIG
jgi:DNA invertase Pin-like site-specific DNA recombinase